MLDRQVVSILEKSNRPLGAYDIVRRGRDTQVQLQPAQVYRVLARLVRRGKLQRVELLSAYMIASPSHDGLLVCQRCHAVEGFALPGLDHEIARHCADRNFSMTRGILEIFGLCQECKRRRR